MAEWVKVAPPLNNLPIAALCSFNNNVYGGTRSSGVLEGQLLQWDGISSWVSVAPEYDTSGELNALIVYNTLLYGGYKVVGG